MSKCFRLGTYLVVQQLRLPSCNARGADSSPGRGTKACMPRNVAPKNSHYIWGVWVSEGESLSLFSVWPCLIVQTPTSSDAGRKKKRLLGRAHPVELLMGPPPWPMLLLPRFHLFHFSGLFGVFCPPVWGNSPCSPPQGKEYMIRAKSHH